MTTAIEKLRQYGYELPTPPLPVASYVPVTRTGNLLYVSGQISSSADGVVTGRLGDTMNVVQGGNAAELAAVNIARHQFHPECVEALIREVEKRGEKHGDGFERDAEFENAPIAGVGSAGLGDLAEGAVPERASTPATS